MNRFTARFSLASALPPGSMRLELHSTAYQGAGWLHEAIGGGWNVLLWGTPRVNGRRADDAASWLARRLESGSAPISLLASLDGEFNLILWRENNLQAMLATDRVGHAPFYYLRSNQELWCGSHPLALARAAGLSPELDPTGLALYMGLKGVPAPHSLVKGISKVTPGSLLCFKPANMDQARYWSPLDAADRFSGSMPDAAGQFLRLLDESISGFILPVSEGGGQSAGIFLSGGLDSSVVAALAKRQGIALTALTAGYQPATRTDETRYASKVAAELGLPQRGTRSSAAELLALFQRVVPQLAEPVADSSFLPQLALAEQYAAGLPLILEGTGADGLLGGSNKHKVERYARLYRRIPGWLRKELVVPLSNLMPSSRRWRLTNLARQWQFFLAGADLPAEEQELFWSRLMGSVAVSGLLQPEYRSLGDPAGECLRLALEFAAPLDHLSRLAWMSLTCIQPWTELHKLSSIEALIGVQICSPFLTSDMILFALSLPDEYKVEGSHGKLVLRSASLGIVPACVQERRKANFSPPVADWLRQDFAPLFNDLLDAQPIFDARRVRSLLTRQNAGWRDFQSELWAIFSLLYWWEQNNQTSL